MLPGSGITWQNRGTSFALDPARQNALLPRRRPFHTIQPAMALLDDGRVMPYGTMGGEGQPQTQAAVYTRHVMFGQELQSRGQRAALAARPHLGQRGDQPAHREPLRSGGRRRRSSAAGHDVEVIGCLRRGDGPRRCARAASLGCARGRHRRRIRPAQRRPSRWILKAPAVVR